MAACSYTTSFVLVNQSARPIEVRYRVAESQAEPLSLVGGGPAKTAEAKLGNADKEWRALSPDEYRLDAGARTVTLTLMPGEALRLMRLTNYQGGDPFYVEEVIIKGEGGEVRYSGQEVRGKFVEQSETMYTLTHK